MINKINIKIWTYIILLIVSITVIIFVNNNYFLYENEIFRVIEVQNEDIEYNNIQQNLTGIIKNGKYKGRKLSVINQVQKSEIYGDKISKNDELIVLCSNEGTEIVRIKDIKRDKYIAILLVLLFDLTIIIGSSKGFKSLISLTFDIIISMNVLYYYINYSWKIKLIPLFIILSIIFIISSLLICNGATKKTLAAILSSIISLLLSFSLAYVILNYYNQSINYSNMDYVEALGDFKGIFYINILLCGLGAIMDISITMASSINEIIVKNPMINFKKLKKSGKEISSDILGTMTNVMLFTCYVSIIPIVLIALKNSFPIFTALDRYGQLEMIRILTSCISIVLAIPISLYVSLWILRGEKSHD